MTRPITKIELTGFRGATETFDLDFDPSRDLTMLFGENGSGKSTILDAIDIACNGGTGTLEDVSVGRNSAQYLRSLRTPQSALKVVVRSGRELWTCTMQNNSMSTAGPGIKPRVKVLRRSRILSLVTAEPRERYSALQHFIDIAVIEQSESNLQQKIRGVGQSINSLIGAKERQLTQLENVWEEEKRPGPGHTAMDWAKDKIDTGIEELNSQLGRLKDVVDAVKETSTAKNDHHSKASAREIKQNDLSEIEDMIRNAPGLNPNTAVQLIESLSKAKEYIDIEPTLDKCPTCLRPIARDELISVVGKQLNQMSELKALSDRKNKAKRQLSTATDILSQAKTAFMTALQNLQQIVAEGDIAEVAALNITWPEWSAEELDYDALRTIGEAFESLSQTLEQKREDVQRDVNQFNSIKEWYEGIQQADEEAKNLDRIRLGLERAFEIVHRRRMSFTQDILNDIATEANRLFQSIHPDEDIALGSLSMDEARRGSVIQSGEFHGHDDIPPQAVFSDSHLDTLGFCVWLALAKREAPEDTVILIDDVFTSVDGPHVGRIVDLLAAESPQFLQVLVASHFRLWWDRCQNAPGVQRIHLGRWTVGNGIFAQNMPLVTQQLQDLANAPILERQSVSSKAGILLENVLDGLSLIYERPLPRNKQNLYTLGDLSNACSKLFTRHNLTLKRNTNWNVAGQPEDWQPMAAQEAFSRITALQFIRNQVGCHFNPPGTEIPDKEVREFGRATVDLVEALTCPNCGHLATKVTTTGTALRCSCNKQAVRMTPVTLR